MLNVYLSSLRKPFLFALAGTVIATALIAAERKPLRWKATSNYQATDQPVSIRTLAGGLQVVHIKRQGQQITLKLKNAYDKSITAFVISAGTLYLERDYIISYSEKERAIPPGATLDYEIPQTSHQPDVIMIRAAIFSDASGDGDKSSIQGIFDKRAGLKKQLENFRPHLAKLAAEKDETVVEAIEKVKRIIPTLPTEDDSQKAKNYKLALRHGKKVVANDLDKLERLAQGGDFKYFRRELAILDAYYKELIERL